MLFASATDTAIRLASRKETLRITREHSQRFGNQYWMISDEHGLIEVALSPEEAYQRVKECTQ